MVVVKKSFYRTIREIIEKINDKNNSELNVQNLMFNSKTIIYKDNSKKEHAGYIEGTSLYLYDSNLADRFAEELNKVFICDDWEVFLI